MHFKVVHVGAVGVDFSSDRMSRSMNKFFAEACFGDAFANGVIHLPSGNLLAGSDGVLHEFHAGVTRIADDAEDFLNLLGRSCSHTTDPGDVVVHGVRDVLLAPDVEKNEITFANWL